MLNLIGAFEGILTSLKTGTPAQIAITGKVQRGRTRRTTHRTPRRPPSTSPRAVPATCTRSCSAARAKLDRNVWDYLIGGAETETTVRRNRLAIDSLAFRPRILRNVNVTDTSATFLKRKFTMPVALAPIGSIERFDPAPARRRRRRRHVRLPDVPELGGEARHRGDRQGRAEGPEDLPALRARRPGLGRGDLRPRGAAGFGALCLTVDTHHYSRRERDISKRYSAGFGPHRRALRSIRARSTGRSSTSSGSATSSR
jgi:hypothetical protein